MTLRKLLMIATGSICLASAPPASADDFSFGFSFGYGRRYCRTYVPRTYVYREYCSPVVVYRDYCPDVVVVDPLPRVYYYREYWRPAVVYREYRPWVYHRTTYVSRAYGPSYRVHCSPSYRVRYYDRYPAYRTRYVYRR